MEYRILKGAERLKDAEVIGGKVKMAEKVVEMKGTEKKMEDKFKSAMNKTGKGLSVFGAAFVKQVSSVDTIAAGAGLAGYGIYKATNNKESFNKMKW